MHSKFLWNVFAFTTQPNYVEGASRNYSDVWLKLIGRWKGIRNQFLSMSMESFWRNKEFVLYRIVIVQLQRWFLIDSIYSSLVYSYLYVLCLYIFFFFWFLIISSVSFLRYNLIRCVEATLSPNLIIIALYKYYF